MGIHPGDFVIPVCHQGMNRSQVMRMALAGVIDKLHPGDEMGTKSDWLG